MKGDEGVEATKSFSDLYSLAGIVWIRYGGVS